MKNRMFTPEFKLDIVKASLSGQKSIVRYCQVVFPGQVTPRVNFFKAIQTAVNHFICPLCSFRQPGYFIPYRKLLPHLGTIIHGCHLMPLGPKMLPDWTLG